MRHRPLPHVRTRTARSLAGAALASVAALSPACGEYDDVPDAPDTPERALAPAPLAQVASAGEEPVCSLWKTARAGLTTATWTGGSVDTCSAGDLSTAAREDALSLVNLYRTMAGLPAVTMTAETNRLAQACALLMRANGTITHTPPSAWRCYTAEGARVANASSLASQEAVSAVDAYLIDPGNPTTIGHRRWLLSNWLTEVGFGSADRFSCQYQPARATNTRGAKAWVAWPPPGDVPVQSLSNRWSSLDDTGWSLQSDSIDLRNATVSVSVSVSGVARPVRVTQLGANYGSRYALRFNPSGWKASAGETYSVQVSGIATPIAYDVRVVDCR